MAGSSLRFSRGQVDDQALTVKLVARCGIRVNAVLRAREGKETAA